MKKLTLILIIAVLAALLLNGCSLMVPPTPAPTLAPGHTPEPVGLVAVEPEQLISKAEAEQLLGAGNYLNDVKKDSLLSSGMKVCFYGPTQKNGKFMQVAIYEKALMPDSTTIPRNVFDAMKTPTPATPKPGATSTPTPTPTPNQTPALTMITGVGDEAYFAVPGIHIMYQGYYIIISVSNPDDPANKEILKAAGLKAVDNLKKILAVAPAPSPSLAPTPSAG